MIDRRVYYIRHGETEDNAAGVYSGQRETPLTDNGRRQARNAVLGISKLELTHIFSSDLERALDTADIIAAGIRFPEDLIRTTADLREVDVGSLAGKPNKGIEYLQEMRRHDPGIESTDRVFARLRNLLADLPPVGSVLLVGHGGVGRYLIAMLQGIEPQDVPGLENCKVIEIEVTSA